MEYSTNEWGLFNEENLVLVQQGYAAGADEIKDEVLKQNKPYRQSQRAPGPYVFR